MTCGFKQGLEMRTVLDDSAADGVKHIVRSVTQFAYQIIHCIFLVNKFVPILRSHLGKLQVLVNGMI